MASTHQPSEGERTTGRLFVGRGMRNDGMSSAPSRATKTILNCIPWQRIVRQIFVGVFEAGGLVMAWIVVGSLIIWLLAIAFAGLKLAGYSDWSWWTVTIPLWAPMLVAVLVAVVLIPTHGYRRMSRLARGFLRNADRPQRHREPPRNPR